MCASRVLHQVLLLSVFLFTDMSQTGRGVHLQDLTAVGTWTSQEELHINILEMKVVHLSLNALPCRIKGETMIFICDNTMVVAYLKTCAGWPRRSSPVRAAHGPHERETHSKEEHSSRSVKLFGSDPSHGMIPFLGVQHHLQGIQLSSVGPICHQGKQCPHLYAIHYGVEGKCFSAPVGSPNHLYLPSMCSSKAGFVKSDA